MRIEKIRIFNINSLKGKNVIDFTQEPLKSSGLFAITGPTGAGKSTILDVIMLGLFNYIPRLQSKLSSNSIEKMGSIVTHYCDEAWVEVEYSCTAGKFRSRWSIQKKSRGIGFRDYEMDLIELPSEKSLGLKKANVPVENSARIGLNAKQFLKTILLSQGGFARFLRASKEERTNLLEEITGAKVYREIGKKAFQKKSEKEAEIKEHEAKLSTIELLSEEEINGLDSELNTANESLSHLKAARKALFNLSELQKLNNNISLQEKSINETKVSIFQTQQDFDKSAPKLLSHETVSKHLTSIQLHASTLQSLAGLNSDNNNLKKQISSDETTITATLNEASLLTHNSLSQENILDHLSQFRSTILAADQARSQALSDGKRIREAINSELERTKIKSSTISSLASQPKIDPALALNLISTQLKTTTNTSQSRSELQEQWKNLSTKIDLTRQLHTLVSERHTHSDSIAKHQQAIDSFKAELKKESDALQPIPSKIKTLENTLKDKKKQQQELLEKGKWKAELEKLVDNAPCPLCGSTDHPYSVHKELTDISIIAAELLRIEEEIDQLTRLEKQIKENITTATVNLDRFEDEKVRTNALIKNINATVEELTSSHNFLDSTAHLESEISSFQQNQLATQKALDELDEKLLLQELKSEFNALQGSIDLYKSRHAELTKLYTGKSIETDVDKLKSSFNNANQRISINKPRFEENKKQITSLTTKIDSLDKDLADVLIEMKVTKVSELLSFSLSDQELTSINNLKDKLLSLNSSLITKEESLSQLKQQFNSSHSALSPSDQEAFLQPSTSLTSQQANLEQKEAAINNTIGSISQKLTANSNLIKKQKEFVDQLKQLNKGAKKYRLLSEMIGDSQGKNWAAYAQNLTFMQLISRANARLENLTDRYILYFDPEQDSLIVIDKYAGDKMRSVETLSGGETFLLSLALALSLSDFASNNISIESLFIDEGFATLDNETLDSVMTTLEKLQDQSGKIIGIISHVESLKDRINTQIQVNKSSEGFSEITITN